MVDLRPLDDLSDDELAAVYAPDSSPWLRLNFVQTLDGSAVGADGLSTSINNDADGRVFALLRSLADAIVVGAGTIREEGYQPNAKPMVIVSRSGDVPPTLQEGDLSQVHLATVANAPGLAAARSLLGSRVLVLGQSGLDLPLLRRTLVSDLGFSSLLCEGGPSLARDMLAAGVVDELCLTTVPRLVAGSGPGILSGAAVDVPLTLASLLESSGTLLARWLVS